VQPEDGQARPKYVVTFDNKIQNQDSCVFRQIPPPSFDAQKHNGDDEPEDYTGLDFTGINGQYRYPSSSLGVIGSHDSVVGQNSFAQIYCGKSRGM
jgi:hypothetical protein